MEIKDPFWGLFSSVNNKYLTIYKEWCRVKVSKEFHRIGCNSVHYPIRKEEVFMMKELKPIKEGKVREIYDNGDSLIMVATDRISCFDVILNNVVTKKGTVLTQMSKLVRSDRRHPSESYDLCRRKRHAGIFPAGEI